MKHRFKLAVGNLVSLIFLMTMSAIASAAPAQAVDQRPIVALLGINSTHDDAMAVMRPIELSIIHSLKKIRELHVLTDLQAAVINAKVANPRTVDLNAAREIGTFAEADFVIEGNERYDGHTWNINTKVIGVKTGTIAEKASSATNWTELQQQVTEGILQAVKITPTEAERQQQRGIWETPLAVLQKYCEASQVLYSDHSANGQSRLEAMLKTEPSFPEADSLLAANEFADGDKTAAEALAQQAVTLDPHSANAHFVLGEILVSEGKVDPALSQFMAAYREDPDDPLTCRYIGDIYWEVQNELAPALDYYQRALRANPHGRLSGVLSTNIAFFTPRQTVHFITNSPPPDIDTAALCTRLNLSLPPADKLIDNPLQSTKAMKQFARQLTAGSTNEMEKARRIYRYLERLTARSTLMDASQLTARKIFANRDNLKYGVFCQTATYLYIALARAAGLRAYFTDVIEACDGSHGAHCCTAVYADGKGLLADPTFHWFGAAHKQFKILDDDETMAFYLTESEPRSPDHLRLAAKIAPHFAFVQFQLGFLLLTTNDPAGAAAALQQIQQCDETGVYADQLAGLIALSKGNADLAVTLMQKAIKLDNVDFSLYAQLGDAYRAAGKPEEARSAYEEALTHPHPEEADAQAKQILKGLADH